MDHFPVYEPSADRVAAIQTAASEAENPLNVHYDASRENRAKGAAFYTFSGDEEKRKAEMEALKRAREETEAARKEAGAMDVRPGESEGLASDSTAKDGVAKNGEGERKKAERSRAMDKRKREIEERRKLVEAKRGKVKGLPELEPESASLPPPKVERIKASEATAPPMDVNDPFAALEAKVQKLPASSDHDEGSNTKKSKSRWDKKADGARTKNAADDFLAKLELDLTFKKSGSGR
jgi:hypothetical protein